MSIQLMQGDCLERMLEIPNNSVDLILTDLPYGTTQCKWDTIIPFQPLWEHYWRILKKDGSIVLFAGQPFTSVLIASQLETFRYSWVWEKNIPTGHLNARRMPMRKHEDVYVFSRGKVKYNPQGLLPFNKMTKRGHNGDNFGKSGTENFQEFTNYPTDILKFNKDVPSLHPTQKPVGLLEYLIATYTDAGDTVMDSTMGSGSTGVAAIRTNRNFIGIEKESKYFDIASDRINSTNTVSATESIDE